MPSKNTFLWQLTNESVSDHSYLFGTMHVRDQQAFGKLDLVKEKILDCDSFALEFNIDDSKGLTSMGLGLKEKLDLKELIPRKKFEKLRRVILKSTSLDIQYFSKMPPFLLISAITEQMLGKEMPVALDHLLWQYAKEENKELLGIESFEEQMEILKNIPIDLQLKMLLSLGKNINKVRKSTLHLAKLYQKGDLQQLTKSVSKGTKHLRKVLLYKRNEIMAERIYHLTSKGTIFSAIGAGHLGGSKGVLRLLKKKGIRLKPIT